jgi:hypothetical protein
MTIVAVLGNSNHPKEPGAKEKGCKQWVTQWTVRCAGMLLLLNNVNKVMVMRGISCNDDLFSSSKANN